MLKGNNKEFVKCLNDGLKTSTDVIVNHSKNQAKITKNECSGF